VRRQHVGDGILLRGLIEFSNECRNACAYCGLNKNNKKLVRYRLSRQELLDCVAAVAASGIKTVVLQSGEDDGLDVLWLKDIIETIKQKYDMTVTLSVGERKFDDYKIWREAGADRFLLKIETTDKNLYESLHGGMSFENRIECLQQLKRLGFQTGSGIIVGLKNQTLSMIAKDIIFFKNQDFDMIGIGPFIPHPETLLMREPLGAVDLTLKVVALTRIVTKNAHLPATTALGSLQEDFRIQALEVGANVLMPNFTPQPFRKFFEIYPNKRCIDEPQGVCASCMEPLAKSIGRSIDYSRGDSFKKKNV
jgi:biotin synthase